jgi:HSP20 family protein
MQEDKRKDLKKNEKVESTRGYIYETPACDIYENKDNYKIYFDIPGVEKDDISLKVEKDVLTLIAECSKKADKGYECIREEMVYAGYKRTFELNNAVDSNKIDANYTNGTLVLTLPKKEEQRTKEIKINVA